MVNKMSYQYPQYPQYPQTAQSQEGREADSKPKEKSSHIWAVVILVILIIGGGVLWVLNMTGKIDLRKILGLSKVSQRKPPEEASDVETIQSLKRKKRELAEEACLELASTDGATDIEHCIREQCCSVPGCVESSNDFMCE